MRSIHLVLTALGILSLGLHAPAQDADPKPRSKKGLQVQLVDDALELGISHACLNVQLGHLLRGFSDENPPGADEPIVAEGLCVRSGVLDGLDGQVRPLAAAGVELSLILLARATGHPEIDAAQFDPRYDPKAPNRLGAFRVLDEEGAATFRRLISVLAERYRPDSEIGHVRGWIVGNEVNSHWWWYNLGEATVDEIVDAYEPAVRIVHEAVSGLDESARVYISLEHHWASRFAAGNPKQSLNGRDLIDRFAAKARTNGDFPWHIAFHPYPENLFDCRFWEDETATDSFDTQRITFKNVDVLTRYLRREELLFDGEARRVILSEQGFHCRDDAQGERDQAAAFALAWRKVVENDGIDAFIYHRHVDHKHEGGLRFGLWRNADGTVVDPGRRRPLWELFRVCDREGGEAAIANALKAVGL